MALQKQAVTVNLSAGIDTKTDPKDVIPGKLATLENAVFTSRKRLRKRNGFAALAALPTANGQALASYLSELVACDKSSLYSYDVANAAWINKGGFVSANVSSTPIIRNTYQQTSQDSATHASGLAAFAWEDSQGGSRYSVIDTATGQTIVPSTLISATAIKPKVLAIGGFLLILYVDTSAVKIFGATISISAPTAALTLTALTPAGGNNALLAAAPNYDATVFNSTSGMQLALAYSNSTPTTGGITAYLAPAATPTALGSPVTIVAEPGTAITVFADLYRMGPVIAYWNGTAVRYRAYDSTFATLLGSGLLETVANVVSISGCSTSATALSLSIFYSTSAAATYNYATRVNTVTLSYAAGTAASFLRSVALAGKAFAYAARAYVPLAYQSPLQSTYFVADGTGNVVAKALPGLGGGIPARVSNGAAMLPESNALANGTTWQTAYLSKNLLTTVSGQAYTLTGVQSVAFNFFDAANSYLRAVLGQNLHLSGGVLQMYDGIGPVEHGFHVYPEPVTAAAVGSGGSLSAGVYQVACCYEWMDNQGQIHRSAPSVAVSVTVVASGAITVTVPTLRLTAKTGARAPVTVVTYRTIVNGTTFYQDSTIASPTLNSTTADTVTFTATQSDTALQGNPLLYTTGNVLANYPAPPMSSLTVHRNRIVGIDSTNPLQRWYSKQVVPGAPVEFSNFFVLNSDPRGGVCTAVASLDDKMITFKSSSIVFTAGQGPDATGGQNDFSDDILITTDCGCTNPRSIVLMPAGLMFQSAKGFYLLDRSLSVSYIGADVEGYNSATVTSAVLVPNTNQVRFTLSSGIALVFDYLAHQWSVFTNVNAVDSAIFGGVHCYLQPAGATMQETPGVYSDAGNYIKLRAVTSWLQFAGVQGFQRVYAALLLGEFASAHQLLLQVAYDFNVAPTQQDYITPVAPDVYGSDTAYGLETVFGGAYPIYQYRLFLAQQKCEAVQISIEDVSTGTVGEGMSLTALTFLVGVKSGLNRMPSTRSVG